jgi:hypothetical protein
VQTRSRVLFSVSIIGSIIGSTVKCTTLRCLRQQFGRCWFALMLVAADVVDDVIHFVETVVVTVV